MKKEKKFIKLSLESSFYNKIQRQAVKEGYGNELIHFTKLLIKRGLGKK